MDPLRPLHPPPGPVEALSSWLARLAVIYGLSVPELLRHNLGAAPGQLSGAMLAALDWDPPAAMPAALAERTGVGVAHLQTMTIAGWVPWLTDTLSTGDGLDAQELFDTYVRQDSVLLPHGAAGHNEVYRWRGPWRTTPAPLWSPRACPVCAADPERGTALMWRLPIMASCVEHSCRLEPALEVNLARSRHTPITATPVDEHVGALDRLTHQGLTTGRVTLPGRSMHVGVWFRLPARCSTNSASSPPASRSDPDSRWSTSGRSPPAPPG